MKASMCLIVSMLLVISSRADEMVFEMSVWGYTFGTMVVSRTIENDSTEIYMVEAKGETDFFWMKRKEESSHRIKYVNGQLQSSEYVYLNRGEKEKWANVFFDNGHYSIESNNGTSTLNEKAIDYSLVKFYFEPSFEQSAVFCEEDCSYSAITPFPEKNMIKILCEDGNRSTYHIENGQVRRMEIHLPIATVKLKRVS